MAPTIELAKLTKLYGHIRAIDQLDLSVEPGQIFGFLGPNGAGKTTTIRLMLDLIRPSGGTVRLLGKDPTANPDLRRNVGYLPGELALYESLTSRQFLDFIAAMRGMQAHSYADVLAERLGLNLDRPIGQLSKGNKQKVGLVQALMHRPQLLILDEPTSGLDPLVQEEFHQIANEAAQEGRTVFLSSHLLDEVQHLAHKVAIIRSGRLVAVQEVDSLRRQAQQSVELKFGEPIDTTDFMHLPGVHQVEGDGAVLHCRVSGDVDALIKTAARYHVVTINSAPADLDDVFLDFYREEPAHVDA